MSEIIGNKDIFAIEYSFFDDSKSTEISLFHNCKNIMSYEKNNKTYTTRWNLDEIVIWLKKLVDGLSEDAYPISNIEGTFAAQKDDNARDFDADDDNEFEEYYNQLYQWNLKHRWHTVNTGEIIADIYFQLVGDNVEISWNNKGLESDVIYLSTEGGFYVERNLFTNVVSRFIEAYQSHWKIE